MRHFFLKKFLFFLSVFSVLLMAAPVLAGDYGLTETSKAVGFETGDQNTFSGIITRVVPTVFVVLSFAFFGLMLYAGFRWLTSQGNEDAISNAKDTMQTAIIGVVIVTVSYAITRFVLTKLSGG